MAEVEVDMLIVGAGPTGLFGAYYAGFRGLGVAVVDALPEVGGQISAMYPEKRIYDVAGTPGVRGRELVASLVEQAAPYDPVYLLGRRAERLRYADDRALVGLSDGTTVRARAVLITGGIGSFTPRPLPAAAKFARPGVAYFVPEPDDYMDRDVVIVGGGDSAFDWAAMLEPLARSVTLVHRRDRFRAHQATVAAVQAEILVNSEVSELRGETTLDSVVITHLPDGTTTEVKAQRLIAALGFTTDLGPLADWGLTMAARRIAVDTHMATYLPLVYGAGDIVDYPGKVRLIAVGFGEVATAVNNAAVRIDPEAALMPGHSTDVAE
ncbi:MAG TPA: NAD(P)/FAD-dependent oxidoreductase [Pseudonocardiaceae bacterium]|nr:NAD(P)/FAD-dependent oxidoreductase [Pseudonocardiaceae bacterium]